MSSVSSLKTLLAVWASLLVLLGLTTASSYVSLGIGNTLINFAIAVMKIGLIALFFMHLRRADAAVRLAAATAFLFLFFLAFLSFADLLTRPRLQAPWQAPAQRSPTGGPYGSLARLIQNHADDAAYEIAQAYAYRTQLDAHQ
jgi:cytochrome c oxidase subunit 4